MPLRLLLRKMNDRHTIRRNEKEKAELQAFMKLQGIDNESEAYKTAVRWCNQYIKNVTDMFFPSTHDVVLVKKTKSHRLDKRVY
jgi:hypothetical protein